MGINPLTLELILLLASSYVNMALYTVELGLSILYFRRPSRPRLHKIAVSIMVLADTICTLGMCINGIMTAVGIPPTAENLRLLLTPLSSGIITTYVSATIEQLFLCNLFYILTRNRIVSAFLVLMICVHLGFSWAAGILVVTYPGTTGKIIVATTVGAVTCAATDITIAAALSWKFWKMMEGTSEEHSSNGLLHRTLVLTVSSGAIVAGNTLIMMILLLKSDLGFIVFFSSQGRVYALTLLGNFLIGIPAQRRRSNHVSTPTLGTSIPVFNVSATGDERDGGSGPRAHSRSRASQSRILSPYNTPVTPRTSTAFITTTEHSLHLPTSNDDDDTSGETYVLTPIDAKSKSRSPSVSARTSLDA
ncbi:hypothetical protein C8F01DRAFT_160868 [Mycena amicta]|nr:hypothetical protein C8F01DRAFT_160868 [Mycena amicta]